MSPSSPSASSAHPTLRGLAAAHSDLDVASTGNPVFLSTTEKEAALRELARLERRVVGLKLAVLGVADDVALAHGAASSAAWLAHQTCAERRAGRREGRLADALATRWTAVADALLEGRLGLDHAHVIATALEALPRAAGDEVVAKAEGHLIGEAAHHTPHELRILGRRVLEVVAPDRFDDHERRLLEAEEARARRLTHLTTRRHGDGTTTITIKTPDPIASRLLTYLEAHANPRRSDGRRVTPDPTDRRPYPERLGHAFCALMESLPGEVLPLHGGSTTTVIVTIDVTQLRDGVGAAELATGERISVSEARRLACTAGLLPAVLDGASRPLDLGRTKRLFSAAQRKALALRDRHCRADGCSLPAAWCEAHHAEPWSAGGGTDLRNAVLLCSRHHHLAHDPAYAVTRAVTRAGPTWTFTRRT